MSNPQKTQQNTAINPMAFRISLTSWPDIGRRRWHPHRHGIPPEVVFFLDRVPGGDPATHLGLVVVGEQHGFARFSFDGSSNGPYRGGAPVSHQIGGIVHDHAGTDGSVFVRVVGQQLVGGLVAAASVDAIRIVVVVIVVLVAAFDHSHCHDGKGGTGGGGSHRRGE